MNYDAIIIGAGMSGLAAGIRLAMFDKRVVIIEKHSVPGGLNSYYQRRNFQKGGIRHFDVGLHALTNFIKKGEKGKPFSKLLKQLRLSYDDFKLWPQSYSKIQFPDATLRFSNDFELLLSEVEQNFPHEREAFQRLVKKVQNFNELDLSLGFQSARAVLERTLSDELLREMLLCPLLIYGSAWEDDMDWAQFVIMFKSLYFEGFSRPQGGVRVIISLLMEKLRALGAEVRMRTAVSEVLTNERGEAVGVVAGGEELRAPLIFSSIGLPETVSITPALKDKLSPRVGPMTFMESLFVFDKKIPLEQNDSTIIFYNDGARYQYRRANDFFDANSAVICFPDNYEPLARDGEGMVRVTFMANYAHWRDLERGAYEEKKLAVADAALGLVNKLLPAHGEVPLFQDVFSPVTIERYTWHFEGTVYGSTDKLRDGRTPLKNLFIIGTDQGFLGIVGALLSGISMANLHGLMNSEVGAP